MEDPLYTFAEEDSFSVTPLFKQPRRRRSSLFNKWILDQQAYSGTLHAIPDDGGVPIANSSPVESHQTIESSVACPSLEQPSMLPQGNASLVTITSYDFVDDTDLPTDSDFVQVRGSSMSIALHNPTFSLIHSHCRHPRIPTEHPSFSLPRLPYGACIFLSVRASHRGVVYHHLPPRLHLTPPRDRHFSR